MTPIRFTVRNAAGDYLSATFLNGREYSEREETLRREFCRGVEKHGGQIVEVGRA